MVLSHTASHLPLSVTGGVAGMVTLPCGNASLAGQAPAFLIHSLGSDSGAPPSQKWNLMIWLLQALRPVPPTPDPDPLKLLMQMFYWSSSWTCRPSDLPFTFSATFNNMYFTKISSTITFYFRLPKNAQFQIKTTKHLYITSLPPFPQFSECSSEIKSVSFWGSSVCF